MQLAGVPFSSLLNLQLSELTMIWYIDYVLLC
jgi:hypothetical protein